MTFLEAKNNCISKNYNVYTGRASRSEFWWFQLFRIGGIAIGVTLSFLLAFIIPPVFPIITFVFWGLTLVPHVCVFIRRLHDVGISGKFLLTSFLVTPIGMLLVGNVICCFPGKPGFSCYGPDPLEPEPEQLPQI